MGMSPMNTSLNSRTDEQFWKMKVIEKHGRLRVSSAGCNSVPSHVAQLLVATGRFRIEEQPRGKRGWRAVKLAGQVGFYLVLVEKEDNDVPCE